jgi:dsDNA-binding SOS-regulon protein
MSKAEMVQEALASLGEATAEQLSSFIQERHGDLIKPAIVAVIRATLRDKELLVIYRRQARELVDQALRAEKTPAA